MAQLVTNLTFGLVASVVVIGPARTMVRSTAISLDIILRWSRVVASLLTTGFGKLLSRILLFRPVRVVGGSNKLLGCSFQTP